jgi:hypothetical protein
MKVSDRKCHIVTDTLGLLLVVAVTAASVWDLEVAFRPKLRLAAQAHSPKDPDQGQ